ncbi:MAG: universal stress protein [Pseudolabrys sp.]|jgi:nucleotide-binding universal stress UspA family protein
MYKQILVPVDGSDTSNRALKEAIKLAKDQQAALRLIHVVDGATVYMMTETPYPIADYLKMMREAGQKVLSTCALTTQEAGIKVDTKLVVTESLTQRICDAVNEEAKRWPADLIVIGTHGRHGFNHLMLGSVAEGVIRLATNPVLICRGN